MVAWGPNLGQRISPCGIAHLGHANIIKRWTKIGILALGYPVAVERTVVVAWWHN